MKKIALSIVATFMAIVAVSCNQSSNKNNEQTVSDTPVVSEAGSSAQPKDADTTTTPAVANTDTKETANFSIAPIVADYLALKNALVADDDNAASNAGKKLLATLNKVDMKSIPADKHNKYMDIADDAKENAEHIGNSAGKLDHQREHFASLSEDVNDLITLFGTPQALYQDHCPMFNDGKGAIWLSESKEIKNPYYGSKMLTCGKVEKTITSK
ncbi:hypothetical protein CMU73_04050 [Elizabethkingia anophelis]|uniref:Putative Co/Zn/Cd efflux system membrane fusion protein n=1 Tax=Elizabethkingia anophelis TaxID=1117645 RepID=A0A455ZCB7_9FLAO|nr:MULTISPECIES: DUF3347 domain-containing protein [Bacteroidota]ASV79781.1 DUF3347 domain-containing protein [Elizabethkingia anophelis]MBB1647422.1 hypothetical protein [Sphingobacterium sp. UME9]MDV3551357.1 hypothetical protein [Elizabethkingia anophelis]MDV3569815.1 hypothetical protein [Elizabethkingia anophelis]MDV3619275.1 hypothetical protein [Elizabethkingia anophelis]